MHLLLPDWIGLGGKIKLEIRNLLKACLETETQTFSTFLRGFARQVSVNIPGITEY